ncbi:MAG: hypothetical protein DRO40_00650 [Thermoprotei archaeon]|nr:MAG: hypothetical protein DRO40_00650 [Thermoprotei archaeon]
MGVNAEGILDETIRTYGLLSKRYTRKPWPIIYKVIDENVRTVCDIGCGVGQNTIDICVRYKHVRVCCLDLSWEMAEMAYRRLKKRRLSHRVLVIQADMRALPFRDNVFDSILYIASLHNLPTKKGRVNALKEGYKVLRNKGKMLVTCWAREQLLFFPKILINLFKKILGFKGLESIGDVIITTKIRDREYRRFYHLYTRKELHNDVVNAGFTVLEEGIYIHGRPGVLKPNKNHYIVAEKSIQ